MQLNSDVRHFFEVQRGREVQHGCQSIPGSFDAAWQQMQHPPQMFSKRNQMRASPLPHSFVPEAASSSDPAYVDIRSLEALRAPSRSNMQAGASHIASLASSMPLARCVTPPPGLEDFSLSAISGR